MLLTRTEASPIVPTRTITGHDWPVASVTVAVLVLLWLLKWPLLRAIASYTQARQRRLGRRPPDDHPLPTANKLREHFRRFS